MTKPIALVVALVVTLTMALGSGATAVASSAAPTASKVVAHNAQGTLGSRIVGTTASGRRVTGAFTPLQFSRANGHLRVRGVVSGVVHRANGTTSTFTAIRTLRVKSINGRGVGAGRTVAPRATCDILNLVLGPLDLDLLGLRVHLDRVVLNIVAATGAGNLLGNLLCAVTGLLDNVGILGRLTTLLNRVLAVLNLGA